MLSRFKEYKFPIPNNYDSYNLKCNFYILKCKNCTLNIDITSNN